MLVDLTAMGDLWLTEWDMRRRRSRGRSRWDSTSRRWLMLHMTEVFWRTSSSSWSAPATSASPETGRLSPPSCVSSSSVWETGSLTSMLKSDWFNYEILISDWLAHQYYTNLWLVRYLKFIEPGAVPMGYLNDCVSFSKATHKIPLDFTVTNTNHFLVIF